MTTNIDPNEREDKPDVPLYALRDNNDHDHRDLIDSGYIFLTNMRDGVVEFYREDLRERGFPVISHARAYNTEGIQDKDYSSVWIKADHPIPENLVPVLKELYGDNYPFAE